MAAIAQWLLARDAPRAEHRDHRASTAAIATNTRRFRSRRRDHVALVPALQGVERLREPMDAVAALEPTLKGVAELREPMGRWRPRSDHARAGGACNADAALVEIRPGLEATAAWGRRWIGWRSMRPSLEAVAGLQPSLDRVAGWSAAGGGGGSVGQHGSAGQLRGPMERLAALEAPMSRG